jgi:hypothetical protein
MLLLMHLQEAGVLEDLSLEEIGRFTGVNRSTILRDKRDLPVVEKEYRRPMATQPRVKRELTVEEFAERIGAQPETVRSMIYDGLVSAHKQDEKYPRGRWYILVTELDWWLRPK